jgi:hypothetical protein
MLPDEGEARRQVAQERRLAGGLRARRRGDTRQQHRADGDPEGEQVDRTLGSSPKQATSASGVTSWKSQMPIARPLIWLPICEIAWVTRMV